MKKIDSFINIFRDLSHSGHSLTGKVLSNELTIALKKEIEKLVNRIGKVDYPIHEVIEEIEDQLSQHTQPKVVILRTIRKFTDISPYLLIHIKKEKTEEYGLKTLKIGNTSFYESHFFSHKTLERYCNWEQPRLDYFEANVYEKYIIQCFDLFNRFFNQLDKLCLDYDLDIIKIQEEKGILVWIRDLHQLLGYGYDKKLGEITSFPYQYPNLETKIDSREIDAEQKTNEKSNRVERLDQLFEQTSKFLAVMQILVSEKLIEPNTYIWKDTTKGNKAFLAALIKDLHAKGYYKDKKPPEINTIELICRNTFQWKIGIDTIKRAKPSGFDLSFIPPASTV